jgi:hypothetical protein
MQIHQVPQTGKILKFVCAEDDDVLTDFLLSCSHVRLGRGAGVKL